MLKRPKEVVFEYPQPPAPYPPSQRSGALIGPSGVGKTTTAISMLVGPYKNCYSRVYVFHQVVLRVWIQPGMHGESMSELRWKYQMRKTMWDKWEPDTLEKSSRGIKRSMHIWKQKNIKKDMWSLCSSMILQIKVIRLCIVQQIFWRVYLFGVVILVVHVGYWLKN